MNFNKQPAEVKLQVSKRLGMRYKFSPRPNRIVDKTGETYGDFTVESYSPKSHWIVRCRCGMTHRRASYSFHKVICHSCGVKWETGKQVKVHTKPTFLYVLVADDVTKVGLTNRNVDVRRNEISLSHRKKFSILQVFGPLDTVVAMKLEHDMLDKLRIEYTQLNSKADGATECFINVDRQELLQDIAWRVKQH